MLSPINITACLATATLLVYACSPSVPTIESVQLHHIIMNRIPAGHLYPAHPERGGTARTIAIPSFFMSACEITRTEYADFLIDSRYPASPALTADGLPADTAGGLNHPHHPVTHVTLQDARAYCQWLSRKTGAQIDLPTEREWEYSARAGIKQAPFSWGWGDPDGRAVWNTTGPATVGRFAPNGFGLYDLSGNVYEWCDASEPAPDRQSVLRGGAWSEKEYAQLRIDRRTFVRADYQDADTGFRVVMHPTIRTDGT